MKLFKILTVVISLFVLFAFANAFVNVSQASVEMPSNTIIIDVGHGGLDGGAVGFDGVNEKDINLEIALKLRDALQEYGFNVVMTREEDVDLSDDSLSTISERKTSDMQNRLDIINSTDAMLVLSIHQNYFEEEQYSGAQIFYGQENSQSLAQTLQANIVQYLQPNNNRLATFVDSKYLLNNANKPMVIIECGFLSNEEECLLLQDDEYQNEFVSVIAKAISNF